MSCGCARRIQRSPRARRAAGSPLGRQAWVPGAPLPPGPGCPDAGATLPVAARRPCRGHAPPEPKEKARCERWWGGVAGQAQPAGQIGRWPSGQSAGCPGQLTPPEHCQSHFKVGRLRHQGTCCIKLDQRGSPGREATARALSPPPLPVVGALLEGKRVAHAKMGSLGARLEGTGTRGWSWLLRSHPKHP